MERKTFDKVIGGLWDYFRYPNYPNDKQLAAWYDNLKGLPETEINSIANIIKDLDNVPRNIPKAFKAAWQTYQSTNQDKIIRYEKTTCQHCNSTGVLVFLKFSEELQREYKYICRCGHCENWRNSFGSNSLVASYTKFELMNKGIDEVYPYNRPPRRDIKVNFDVNMKAVLDSVGNHVGGHGKRKKVDHNKEIGDVW